MICEECNNREARFAVTMNVNGESVVRHLCPECMRAMNANMRGGNIAGVLSAILSAITAGEGMRRPESRVREPAEQLPDITCQRCGTTYVQFRKSGRLGCPGCYEAFREQLRSMLQQVSGGAQHAGRRPLETPEAQRTRSRQEELTRLMQQAVALEDFETAALLRDQIHALAAEGGEEA